MLGQIFFGIIILLFLTGSTSILFSIFFENNTPTYYPPPKRQETSAPIDKVAEFISTDSEISEVEEVESVSEILESFTLEDLKVEDDILDIHEEDIYIDEDLLE